MITDSAALTLDSEADALFNPAFCAVLLNKAASGYVAQAGEMMPVTFAFLILPSALHEPTREALPRTIASSMWAWTAAHPVLLMGLAERARTLRRATASGLTHGLRHGVLTASHGSIEAGKLERRPRTLRPTSDWLACVAAAEFLGKWFGASGADEATTFARWGVRP